jgi:hypothetical protein
MPWPGSAEFDKLYKVRPLLDKIHENSQAAYQPHQEVAVDEAMILFKGRSAMRQYMPKKPVKWGYKCWCICDAWNGYMYNLDIYQGASGILDEAGLGATVVQRMVEPLYGCNYHVYIEYFFSSIVLANKLKERRTLMIGTVRTNRRGWPQEMKGAKKLEKEMSCGDSRSKMVDVVECVVWKDKRKVTLVNNITDPEAVSTVLRRNKDGARSSVSCPESVQRYNSYMGGVDMFDARRKTYFCSRKSRTWWLRFFYFLLEAAVTNAYILYKESNLTPGLTTKEFVLKICEYLVASTNCRERLSVQDPPPSK